MERKGFIGGSDCVKIMQGNWLELWQVKTGRVEPDDLSDNVAVQLGIWTESFNLRWFERQHGAVIKNHQMQFEKQIGSVPVKGTIDGRWGEAIVEAKHTNNFNTMDTLIQYYMPQLQLYCHLAGSDGAHLSAIFGNNKWDSAYVGYSEEYFNSMWAVVSDFWGYVIRDQEPIAVDLIQIEMDKIEVDNMVCRDAGTDNEFIDAANRYVENQDQARLFKIAKTDLKNMVADNEREVYCDLITIKRDKRGSLRITPRRV